MDTDLTTPPAEKRSHAAAQVDAAASRTAEAKWKSWAFYLLSAALHLMAAYALSKSWARSQPAAQPSQAAVVVPAPVSPAATLEIDVAPIKYCDLNMDSLLGRKPANPQPTRIQRSSPGTKRPPARRHGTPGLSSHRRPASFTDRRLPDELA
jgi:hypothetical protein